MLSELQLTRLLLAILIVVSLAQSFAIVVMVVDN